jgi:ubiquinone/menaquinone biosynthesis C-methylase UbiE
VSAKPIELIEMDTPSGRFVVVSRHPRSGREIDAFGGARVFRGKKVVDIGTGVGRLAFDAARVAKYVVGVDPHGDAIRTARERCERERIMNLEFRVGDARTFTPRPGERFDLAILSWSL